MSISSGSVNDRFTAVRTAFEANLESGSDTGASFCATRNGETVVDLWGGFADEERTRPWQKDTIVNVYSTTKTMTALTASVTAPTRPIPAAVMRIVKPVPKYHHPHLLPSPDRTTAAAARRASPNPIRAMTG